MKKHVEICKLCKKNYIRVKIRIEIDFLRFFFQSAYQNYHGTHFVEQRD